MVAVCYSVHVTERCLGILWFEIPVMLRNQQKQCEPLHENQQSGFPTKFAQIPGCTTTEDTCSYKLEISVLERINVLSLERKQKC